MAFTFGSIFGFLTIILGAFGAHFLKKKWTPEILSSFETGVKYQMYHALQLLLISFIPNNPYSQIATYLSIIGVFFFSGSIYGICYLKSNNKKVGVLGPITPLGGLLLAGSWLLLFISNC